MRGVQRTDRGIQPFRVKRQSPAACFNWLLKEDDHRYRRSFAFLPQRKRLPVLPCIVSSRAIAIKRALVRLPFSSAPASSPPALPVPPGERARQTNLRLRHLSCIGSHRFLQNPQATGMCRGCCKACLMRSHHKNAHRDVSFFSLLSGLRR